MSIATTALAIQADSSLVLNHSPMDHRIFSPSAKYKKCNTLQNSPVNHDRQNISRPKVDLALAHTHPLTRCHWKGPLALDVSSPLFSFYIPFSSFLRCLAYLQLSTQLFPKRFISKRFILRGKCQHHTFRKWRGMCLLRLVWRLDL